MKKLHVLILLLVCSLQQLFCQWDGNPATVNNPISTSPNDAVDLVMVSDGAGGVIAAWSVYDDDDISSIQMQRKTSVGGIGWQTVNNPITIAIDPINYLEIADIKSDGNGGAYIAWVSYLTDTLSDIYVQHISNTGAKLFGSMGIKLNPANGHLFTKVKLSVNTTGCIVCWGDGQYTFGTSQLFVQRFSSSGVPQWAAGGVMVSSVNSIKNSFEVLGDGSDGVFISFEDFRNSIRDSTGNLKNVNIYAQHINSSGSRLWGTTDALVTGAVNNQSLPYGVGDNGFMITDNEGGFIILYSSTVNNVAGNYAQRMNSSGTRLWANEGVAVLNFVGKMHMASDGANGIVVSGLQINFSTFYNSIYAQRVSGSGAKLWTADGKLINAPNTQSPNSTSMAADGAGNFVFNWTITDPVSFLSVVKGQKINGNGQLLWTADGVNICNNPVADPLNPFILRSSGTNQMISAWIDFRNSNVSGRDIYCAKIDTNGQLITSIVYTSNGSGNWSNPAIWVGNIVPPMGADVIVRHNIVVDINTTCNSLTVQAPGVITVNTGVTLTILR